MRGKYQPANGGGPIMYIGNVACGCCHRSAAPSRRRRRWRASRGPWPDAATTCEHGMGNEMKKYCRRANLARAAAYRCCSRRLGPALIGNKRADLKPLSALGARPILPGEQCAARHEIVGMSRSASRISIKALLNIERERNFMASRRPKSAARTSSAKVMEIRPMAFGRYVRS